MNLVSFTSGSLHPSLLESSVAFTFTACRALLPSSCLQGSNSCQGDHRNQISDQIPLLDPNSRAANLTVFVWMQEKKKKKALVAKIDCRPIVLCWERELLIVLSCCQYLFWSSTYWLGGGGVAEMAGSCAFLYLCPRDKQPLQPDHQ